MKDQKKERLAIIKAVAKDALENIDSFPKNVQDMTPTELEIAAIAEKLCGALKFIEEISDF